MAISLGLGINSYAETECSGASLKLGISVTMWLTALLDWSGPLWDHDAWNESKHSQHGFM